MSEVVWSTSVSATALTFFTDDNARTNVKAITKIYLDVFQDIETAIEAVYISRYIDQATAAQLDLLGALVGRLRANFADAEYRTLIRAQILVNRSDGTSRALTEIIARFIDGTATTASYVDTSDFKFQVTFNTPLSVALADVWAVMLRQAKALGSGDDIVFSTAPKSGALIWCTIADENTTTSTWDDVADSLNKGDWAALA
jgi:hypothetical protein